MITQVYFNVSMSSFLRPSPCDDTEPARQSCKKCDVRQNSCRKDGKSADN